MTPFDIDASKEAIDLNLILREAMIAKGFEQLAPVGETDGVVSLFSKEGRYIPVVISGLDRLKARDAASALSIALNRAEAAAEAHKEGH